MDRPRVFVDSSVLFAASLSPTGYARDLIVLGLRGGIELCLSEFVIRETWRNLTAKYEQAIPFLETVHNAEVWVRVEPSSSLVSDVAEVVVAKGAPIIAGALAASAGLVASYDRKHLLSQAPMIQARYGIRVDTPDNDNIVRHLQSSNDAARE